MFREGAFGSKYNYALIQTVSSLSKFLRPICYGLKSPQDLTDKKLNWIFPVKKKSTGRFEILVRVAQVLDPQEHGDCRKVLSDPDLMCVFMEESRDLNCRAESEGDDIEVLDPGYLTYYYKGERFYLLGVYNHGPWSQAKQCQKLAKKEVAFFTRMDAESMQKGALVNAMFGKLEDQSTCTSGIQIDLWP